MNNTFRRDAAHYVVVAYERGRAVCDVAVGGAGLSAMQAGFFAQDLRAEFPEAIVAIIPAASYSL